MTRSLSRSLSRSVSRSPSRSLAPLVAAALLASPAAAQNMGWSTIIPSVTGTDVLGLVLREQAEQQRGGQAAPSGAALDFTPSPERRAANLARFVGKARGVDRGTAAEMDRAFAAGDFIDRVAGVPTPMGLRVDNLADAYAIWWITAWNTSRGARNSTSGAQAAAVSAQAARALATKPEIVGASDAAKQELAEALLVQMTFIAMGAGQARNDPARLRAVVAEVERSARGMGLDLSAMQLTEAGFVPRRGP